MTMLYLADTTPTSGSHTWKAQVSRSNGTGSLTVVSASTVPLSFYVETVGSAS